VIYERQQWQKQERRVCCRKGDLKGDWALKEGQRLMANRNANKKIPTSICGICVEHMRQ